MDPTRSLVARHPLVAAEWHPTRNGSLTPHDVTYGSGKRAWWLCPDCGNEWNTKVMDRTVGGSGCPPCRRRTRRAGTAGRLTDRPDLVAEWHERNRTTPDQEALGSAAWALWRCRTCSYEWMAQIVSRGRGHGCPACAGSVPSPARNLRVLHPDLMSEWHVTLNWPLTPEMVLPGTKKFAWWCCVVCNHVWQTRINNRTGPKASGCPRCVVAHSREEVFLGYELALFAPVALGSHHVRTDNPRPSKRGSGYTDWDVDLLIPDWRVAIEYDGSYWHAGKKAAFVDRLKTRALRDAGWRVLRLREAPLPLLDSDQVPVVSRDYAGTARAVLGWLRAEGYPVFPGAEAYLGDPEGGLWNQAGAEAAWGRQTRRLSMTPEERAAAEARPELRLVPEHLRAGFVEWRAELDEIARQVAAEVA